MEVRTESIKDKALYESGLFEEGNTTLSPFIKCQTPINQIKCDI